MTRPELKFKKELKHHNLPHQISVLIDESWYDIFAELLPELRKVFNKLSKEKYGDGLIAKPELTTIYPPDGLMFKAFKLCTLTDLKVIILGQDPYHDGSALGVAFDNVIGKKISPSLGNIIKELESDVFLLRKDHSEEQKTYLGHLPSQGVLLLNTALTVETGKPESHLKIWEPFTQKLLKLLGQKENIVWCLWGAKALAYKNIIEDQQRINKIGIHKTEEEFILYPIRTKQYFVISSHPSPFSAHKPLGNYPAFLGSKPFSKINAKLVEWDKPEIKW